MILIFVCESVAYFFHNSRILILFTNDYYAISCHMQVIVAFPQSRSEKHGHRFSFAFSMSFINAFVPRRCSSPPQHLKALRATRPVYLRESGGPAPLIPRPGDPPGTPPLRSAPPLD